MMIPLVIAGGVLYLVLRDNKKRKKAKGPTGNDLPFIQIDAGCGAYTFYPSRDAWNAVIAAPRYAAAKNVAGLPGNPEEVVKIITDKILLGQGGACVIDRDNPATETMGALWDSIAEDVAHGMNEGINPFALVVGQPEGG